MEVYGIWKEVIPYAIVAVKAVVIAVIGWVIAALAGAGVRAIFERFEVLKKQKDLPKSAGDLVYYLILLVTAVAVLEVLGLKYVTQPFLDLLNKVGAYLPNLIGAVVIMVAGGFFAKIAKEFVHSLLDTFQIKEIGEKYGIEDLSGAVANFVYLMILLFVAIAALNALQIEAISKPAIAMIGSILNAVPRIIAAIIIFAIIYYVGRFVADVASKIVNELNFDEIAKVVGISSDKLKFDELVRYVIVAFAVLIGLSQAFHYIEAQALYSITYKFTVIAFKLVVASAIVFAGAYFGSIFESRVENREIGKLIKAAFIVAAIFIALPYVGVSGRVIEIVVFSISIGLGLAFALAFGLGGKDVAAEVLKKLFLRERE